MTIRVLVADDQSMVRAGFRMLLTGEAGHRGRGRGEQRARGGREGGTLPPRRRRSWTSACPSSTASRRPAASSRPTSAARVLILTTFDLDEYVYEALRAGASGFVLKDDPPEQLIAAIRTVAAGDALLSPAVTTRVIEQFARIARARLRPDGARRAEPRASTTSCD